MGAFPAVSSCFPAADRDREYCLHTKRQHWPPDLTFYTLKVTKVDVVEHDEL